MVVALRGEPTSAFDLATRVMASIDSAEVFFEILVELVDTGLIRRVGETMGGNWLYLATQAGEDWLTSLEE